MKKNSFLACAALCALLLGLAGCREPEHIHTPAADDGDCTTKVLCVECDDTLVRAKKSHVDEDLNGVCDNCRVEPDYLYDEETQTYTVYTAKGLYAWAEKRENLILARDIILPEDMCFDLNGDGTMDSNWTPVLLIQRSIDGRDHTISNVVIKSKGDSVGFFGNVRTGDTVKNLHLKDVQIEGAINVAGIAGYANGATIENCSVSGKIFATSSNVAGIAGTGVSATVTACRNDAEISGKSNVGGIVGQFGGGTITACINTGEICPYGDAYGTAAGGIIGTGFGGTVRACCSTGAVGKNEGSNPMSGGIAGASNSITLLNNYWSTPEAGEPEFGSGDKKNNDNALKAENWDSARNAMNTVLANAEILWHYASIVDDDCPLALLPTE